MSTPISPGELVTAHAYLEGTSNCTKCHTLRNKVTDDKCLACHEQINQLITNNRGYHASTEVEQKNCYDCHSDHHGRDFEIIHFDTTAFDHALSGYSLEGKHGDLHCTACHQPGFISDTALRANTETFLGLMPGCVNCHTDPHQGTLSADCATCHDQQAFRPASGFDHASADFLLAGAHTTVDCIGCHPSTMTNGTKYQQFTGLDYENCTPCHRDVHEGKLGADCAGCHLETSFLAVRNRESFNHELTGYRLEGRHQQVDCYGCHQDNCTDPLGHDNCSDCHADYHKGAFTKGRSRRDCAECHSVQGFKPSGYTVDDHQSSAFPLTGAHLETDCYGCHMQNNSLKFKNIGTSCASCHTDIHDQYISASYYPGKDCRSCHNTETWAWVVFDHSSTGYELTGGHAGPTCRDCHFGSATGHGGQAFASLDQDCLQCHTDIHFGQFVSGGTSDCLRCHTFMNWQASEFDHDNTNFRLDGKHKDVACLACHKEVRQDNRTFIKYKIEKYRCEDCH
jgi:hypothetical protein